MIHRFYPRGRELSRRRPLCPGARRGTTGAYSRRLPCARFQSGLIALLLALTPTTLLAAEPKTPNIVIIFTDDQGYGDVGCFGAKGFETPNLDRLAKEGVRFTDFHVSQPVCSASRASLLTGCYANRIGIHGALGPNARARHQRRRRRRSRRSARARATRPAWSASGTSATTRSSCRRGTASTPTSACPIRTTCGRTTPRPRRGRTRTCR